MALRLVFGVWCPLGGSIVLWFGICSSVRPGALRNTGRAAPVRMGRGFSYPTARSPAPAPNQAGQQPSPNSRLSPLELGCEGSRGSGGSKGPQPPLQPPHLAPGPFPSCRHPKILGTPAPFSGQSRLHHPTGDFSRNSPFFHPTGGAAAFVSHGAWPREEACRNRAASAELCTHFVPQKGFLVLEGACHEAQLCLQPSSTLWVQLSSTSLRSQHPHGRHGEGPLFAHVRRPDPVFLPERRLQIFKAALRKTTDFLHFSNLLSRCGEVGSGVSKGSSAAAPPGAGGLRGPASLELLDLALGKVPLGADGTLGELGP